MSHREKSLTPWITNDPDSYLVPNAIRDLFKNHKYPEPFGPTNPVFLPPSLYDRAAKLGYDMTIYAKTPMIPLAPIPGTLTRRGNPK